MKHDDVDDLIGPPAETYPKRKPGRPKGSKNKPAVQTKKLDSKRQPYVKGQDAPPEVDWQPHFDDPQDQNDLFGMVSVTFLGKLFRMAPSTAHQRLTHCPVRGRGLGRKGNLYSLREAAAYLVEPKVDIGEFIRTLRPEELPPRLSKDYWDAEIKKQKWARDAGELWHTEDVQEVFGEVFKRLKTTVQLWADDIDRLHGLTDAQRETLTRYTDGFLEEMFNSLMRMSDERETVNTGKQVDEEGLPLPRKSKDDNDE